jgi:hypothetical protein
MLRADRVVLFVNQLTPGDSPTLMDVMAVRLVVTSNVVGGAVRGSRLSIGSQSAGRTAYLTMNHSASISQVSVILSKSSQEQYTLERIPSETSEIEETSDHHQSNVHLPTRGCAVWLTHLL